MAKSSSKRQSRTRSSPGGVLRWIFTGPPRSGIRPGILLDRDGVINRRIVGGYVAEWRQFKFVRGIKSALAKLSKIGIPLIVVSNQAGAGKGMVTRTALEGITKRFVAELAEAGARIDAVYYCPHIPSENCRCRKPRPSLLEQAARDWRLDLKRSVLLGDSLSDLEAARAANCRAIFFAPGSSSLAGVELKGSRGAVVASKVSEIPRLVLRMFSH